MLMELSCTARTRSERSFHSVYPGCYCTLTLSSKSAVFPVSLNVISDSFLSVGLTQHIAQTAPVDSSLCVQLIQVILHKLDTRSEICLVELVWDVPAEGTKLTTLLKSKEEKDDDGLQRYFLLVFYHFCDGFSFSCTDLNNSVQKGHSVQQRLPLRQVTDL